MFNSERAFFDRLENSEKSFDCVHLLKQQKTKSNKLTPTNYIDRLLQEKCCVKNQHSSNSDKGKKETNNLHTFSPQIKCQTDMADEWLRKPCCQRKRCKSRHVSKAALKSKNFFGMSIKTRTQSRCKQLYKHTPEYIQRQSVWSERREKRHFFWRPDRTHFKMSNVKKCVARMRKLKDDNICKVWRIKSAGREQKTNKMAVLICTTSTQKTTGACKFTISRPRTNRETKNVNSKETYYVRNGFRFESKLNTNKIRSGAVKWPNFAVWKVWKSDGESKVWLRYLIMFSNSKFFRVRERNTQVEQVCVWVYMYTVWFGSKRVIRKVVRQCRPL